MALVLTINGELRSLDGLEPGSTLIETLAALGMKPDRVAVERNGTIVTRSGWSTAVLASGDRLEIVHFVGGGSGGPNNMLQLIRYDRVASSLEVSV